MCGTGLIVAWRPWRREGSLGGGTWGGAVGFGVGFMIAFVAVAGRPELVPVDVTGWLFHAAAVAMVLGLLEAMAPRRVRVCRHGKHKRVARSCPRPARS